MYIKEFMFLSAPVIRDHKNLQTLKKIMDAVDVDVKDMIHDSGGIIRFIKNWVGPSGCTHATCERIFSESFGKSSSPLLCM